MAKTTWRVRTVTESGIVALSGTVDERIGRLASLQAGLVARRQLQAAGLSGRAIDGRIRRGQLTIARPGIYTVGHCAPSEHGRVVAALLTCRSPGLIAGTDAAALWALPVVAASDRVEVLVPARFGARYRPGVVVHRTSDPEHLVPRYVDRIPVTSPAWTLVDIAACLSPRQLERALDEALAIRIVTLDQLVTVIARRPTCRGIRGLRRLVADREAGAPGARTNPGSEEELLTTLRAAQVTGFVCNVRIGDFQIDIWFPHLRLAIEVDSYRWHSQRSSWARDRRKDAYLRDQNIDLLRITSDDISGEPIAVLARILRRIGELERAMAPASNAAQLG